MENIRPIITDYLMKKNQRDLFPPIPPSTNFDVAVSKSTMPTSGLSPATPGIPEMPGFKLTLADLYEPSTTQKLLDSANAAVAPQTPAPAPVPTPAPVTPKPAPAAAVPPKTAEIPASPAPEPTPDPEKGGFNGKEALSVVGKALAAIADARNARIGQKSDFTGGIVKGDRQRVLDERATKEFERKEQLEKEKDNPNSAYSQSLREVAKKVFPTGNFESMTGRDLEQVVGPYMKLFDIEQDAENRRATLKAAELNRDAAREERTTEKRETRIQNLRKEVMGAKPYQGWLDIKNASDNLNEAVENIRAGGPKAKRTIGAVYSYVKALDPGSVVREGEIRLAGEARSLATRLEAGIRKLTTGETMTPAEIKELAEWAQEKEKIARKTAINSIQPTIDQADRLGYDLAEINKDLFGPGTEGAKTRAADNVVEVQTEDEALALPVGTRFKLADGRTGTVK